MQLTLKGKIKKLGNNYGIVKSNDYDEEYFFQKVDVINTDRNWIKIGSKITFELKTNNSRGSNAHRIKLFSDKKNKKYSEGKQQDKKLNISSLINLIFNNEKPHISTLAFQEFITEGFSTLKTDNKELNDLIKLVVRDNVITDVEKIFLKEKTFELNLSTDLVQEANDYLFSNNPFFDNILSLIFKDGKIKENELAFLLEKSKENSFSSSFINNRFWQYAFSFQIDKLLQFKNIVKIIKLWYLSQNTQYDFAFNKDWIILQLNILNNNNIEENIDRALDNFEKKISSFFDKKYHISKSDIEEIYDHIFIDINKDVNEIEISKEKKNINFLSHKVYKKSDIYNILKVPILQQKGKWNDGYCQHNNDWFIFANIDQVARGYSEIKDFDYNNSLDQSGNLNWEAQNKSKLNWESIQKLKESSPFIFIRTPETEKNSWEYFGKGNCVYTIDSTPVKFKWKIRKHEFEEKNIKVQSQDESNIKQNIKIKWNDKIVPEKYKEEILLLLNEDQIFEASQEFLGLAYANGQKNLDKVMKEFERIIEVLDK